MYFYSKARKQKIVHTESCPHIKRIAFENLKWYATAEEAYDVGFHHCKCCDPIRKRNKQELNDLSAFCKQHLIAYSVYGRGMTVSTPFSKWRIIPDTTCSGLKLYHQNTLKTERDNKRTMSMYHDQHIIKTTLLEYFMYITDHDDYRMLNPVKTRRKKKEKSKKQLRHEARMKERWERKNSIRRVLSLIDELSAQPAEAM